MNRRISLVYPPSGKRMIPYPPVGLAVLAGSLESIRDLEVITVDLEVLANNQHFVEQQDLVIYKKDLSLKEVLEFEFSQEIKNYQDFLSDSSELASIDLLGISVMGYNQLVSTLLIIYAAAKKGIRVILGGQFWTYKNAEEFLKIFHEGDITIAIGDGFEPIRQFVMDPDTVPVNSVRLTNNTISFGDTLSVNKEVHFAPDYHSVDWDPYSNYGERIYKSDRNKKRAHLYIWDKKCNFRCSFCRVSTGSEVKLKHPIEAVSSLKTLIDQGVTLFNFMTNELNPSRRYLINLLNEMESKIKADIHWFAYLRADQLYREDFEKIRSCGGRLLRYGMESGSQKLLNRMRKDYNVPTMENTLKYAADSDIWNHVNFLVGYPGEDDEDIEATCEFIKRNKEYIHSIRINPFYLPPDTYLASHPEEFGIKLTKFEKGWWNYEYQDGTQTNAKIIEERINRITSLCLDLGIGFAGTDPFFLLEIIAQFSQVSTAYEFIKRNYSFLWQVAPTDYYKSIIGGYSISNEWNSTIFKRGVNYSLTICTD